MDQASLCAIIRDQTARALWEIRNVINCVPDTLWNKQYYYQPVWKHVYHTLHSLDRWLVNPRDKNFIEPPIHTVNLNNLDIFSETSLTREEISGYLDAVTGKITGYVSSLEDAALLIYPDGCEYTRFTLLLAQFRHLHTHMGMLMAFIISDTGKWPRVLGLTGDFPAGEYDIFD